MNELSTIEQKHARFFLSQIAVGYGFSSPAAMNPVTSVSQNGFVVTGLLMGRYSAENGLTVWSKGTRGAGAEVSVSMLDDLQAEFTRVFAKILEAHEKNTLKDGVL